MNRRYWSDLKVGEELPQVKWTPITRVQIAKFASAVDDFSPLHIDEDYAKAEGFGGVFVHEVMSLALIVEMMRKFAPNMQIVQIVATFHKLVRPGDTLTSFGKVSKQERIHDEHRAEFELWVENVRSEIVAKVVAQTLMWESEADEKKHAKASPTPRSTHVSHELTKAFAALKI